MISTSICCDFTIPAPVPVTSPAPTDPVPVSGPVTLSQSAENIFSIFGKINPMHKHYQV